MSILDRLLAGGEQSQYRCWITGQRRREAAKAMLDILLAEEKQCQCRYCIAGHGKLKREAAKKLMLSCWLEGDCAAAGGSLDKDGERLRRRCQIDCWRKRNSVSAATGLLDKESERIQRRCWTIASQSINKQKHWLIT